MFREVKRTLRRACSIRRVPLWAGGRAGMLQVAGVFLGDPAECPVKDTLLLFRAADLLRVVGFVPK